MPILSADRIFTLDGPILKDHAILVDDLGTIIEIMPKSHYSDQEIKHFSGLLCPGFINAHCHLELSHMKGLVDTGTGLLPFLQNVVKFRDFPEDVIMKAIQEGDAEMYADGIVAVGDISNKADTVETKRTSPLRYHTFVEMFDFMQPSMTTSTIDQYRQVFEAHEHNDKNKKAFVPHAPYTVSKDLFEYISKSNGDDVTVSIHNQETPDENELFQQMSGGFMGFYRDFGMELNGFKATGKNSINYAVEHMNPDHRTLFVHNTTTKAEDIEVAAEWNDDIYWATCPNANLYIENRLPDYQLFIDKGAKVCIGTDSLTSNWQLSIMEEMKTIKKYKSFVTIEQLITWACKNGAEALGFSDLGTLSVGKTPGIVHIDAIIHGDEIDISKATSHRVI